MKSFLLSILAVVASAQAPDAKAAISSVSQLSLLSNLLIATPPFARVLETTPNITILAPNDNAWTTLLNSPAGKSLVGDPDGVTTVFLYHILNGIHPASTFTTSSQFFPSTLNVTSPYTNNTSGQPVEGKVVNNKVVVSSGLKSNATVVQADIRFNGGIIHVIDSVLAMPQTFRTTLVDAGLTSLYGALNRTGLLGNVSDLADVTIFAPSNEAFRNIGSALNGPKESLSSVLRYHVIQGGTPLYSPRIQDNTQVGTIFENSKVTVRVQGKNIFVNNAKVIQPNILVGGGVVHIIDQVLNPQNTTATIGSNAANGIVAFQGATSASADLFISDSPAGNGSAIGAPSSPTSRSYAKSIKTGAPLVAAFVGFGAVSFLC